MPDKVKKIRAKTKYARYQGERRRERNAARRRLRHERLVGHFLRRRAADKRCARHNRRRHPVQRPVVTRLAR